MSLWRYIAFKSIRVIELRFFFLVQYYFKLMMQKMKHYLTFHFKSGEKLSTFFKRKSSTLNIAFRKYYRHYIWILFHRHEKKTSENYNWLSAHFIVNDSSKNTTLYVYIFFLVQYYFKDIIENEIVFDIQF